VVGSDSDETEDGFEKACTQDETKVKEVKIYYFMHLIFVI
jgi:hypothetical protein